MKRNYHLLFLLWVGLGLLACEANDESTHIYLVRHAEKDLNDSTNNPPLTAEGRQRAQKLKSEMEKVPLNGIFSTYYDRNVHTVEPTAQQHKLNVNIYPWYHYQAMLDSIKTQKGKHYLICGHGDNLLPMIEYLGAQKPQESLKKHEYDKLFHLILTEGQVAQVEAKVY